MLISGAPWSRFTAEQLRALGLLPVKHLYKTLEMFVGWINDCLYDFHELPFTVKRPLPPSVPRWFEEKEKSASGEWCWWQEGHSHKYNISLYVCTVCPESSCNVLLLCTYSCMDTHCREQEFSPREVSPEHCIWFMFSLLYVLVHCHECIDELCVSDVV